MKEASLVPVSIYKWIFYQCFLHLNCKGWEQRVSQTPKSDNTPAKNAYQTPRQAPTSATKALDNGASKDTDIAARPVSDIRASWKDQEAKTVPKKEEEPTAYSVGDRMSAWEVMTSANQVKLVWDSTLNLLWNHLILWAGQSTNLSSQRNVYSLYQYLI